MADTTAPLFEKYVIQEIIPKEGHELSEVCEDILGCTCEVIHLSPNDLILIVDKTNSGKERTVRTSSTLKSGFENGNWVVETQNTIYVFS